MTSLLSWTGADPQWTSPSFLDTQRRWFEAASNVSGLTSLETTLKLAETPCEPLGYGFPAREVSELFRVAATTGGPV